jgi:predicted P-loop ATPase
MERIELPGGSGVEGEAKGGSAAQFLKDLRSSGPWTVTAINDGRLNSVTFVERGRGMMAKWIAERNGKINLYWHINPTYGDPGNKASLEDVSHIERLHVDIDLNPSSSLPIEDQRAAILTLLGDEARLKECGIPGVPSFIIDSGGGYWAFWDLVEPYSLDGDSQQARRDNAHHAGGYNKWIATTLNTAFGLHYADDCHNVDRIARLPYTLNIPSAKKRAAGRRPTLSAVIKESTGELYSLNDFGWVDVGEAGPCKEAVAAVKIEGDWQPLPRGDAWGAVQELVRRYPEVRPKTTELILLGAYLHPEGENVPTKVVDGQLVVDRNAPFHRVNRALQQAGVPLGLVIEVLSDARFAVSEHARFPANKGVISKSELRGGELARFVTAQVKKAAAKLRKEAMDARIAAEALDAAGSPPEASSNTAAASSSEAGASSSAPHAPATPSAGGNGAAPPPPPPPGDEGPPEPPGPGNMPRELRFDHAPGADGGVGAPLKSERNILVALRRMGVRLSYNRFADRLLIDGIDGFGPELNDAAVTALWLTIDRLFGFRANKSYFYDVLTNAALANTFHPVLDYLDNLEWDGLPRIDKWLTVFGGAKDTPYTNIVGRLMLLAAVRRLRQPGCKFDEMMVLEGPQGTNKSTALKVLAINEDWFTDDLPLGANSKVMIEQMTGKWIIEVADLHRRKGATVEDIKAQLSRTEDRARLAYGKLSTSVRRQCVFFATTNEDRYLNDPTGERRFWPVFTRHFNITELMEVRNQLWAEAVALEASGASIRMDQKLWAEAALEQSARSMVDPWSEHIEDLLTLDDKLQEGKILASDLWELVNVSPDKRNQKDNNRLGRIMRSLGFERKSLRFDIDGKSKKAWGYARGNTAQQIYVVRNKDTNTFRVNFGQAFPQSSIIDGVENAEIPF